MRSPEFYLWWSYGVTLVALVVEMVALGIRRSRAMKRVEEERDLEAQDYARELDVPPPGDVDDLVIEHILAQQYLAIAAHKRLKIDGRGAEARLVFKRL